MTHENARLRCTLWEIASSPVLHTHVEWENKPPTLAQGINFRFAGRYTLYYRKSTIPLFVSTSDKHGRWFSQPSIGRLHWTNRPKAEFIFGSINQLGYNRRNFTNWILNDEMCMYACMSGC